MMNDGIIDSTSQNWSNTTRKKGFMLKGLSDVRESQHALLLTLIDILKILEFEKVLREARTGNRNMNNS